MARLDTVELFIESESEKHSVIATEYAVEKGEPFTDHVAKRSPEFSISGYIISDDWDTEKNKLITMMENGKIITYVGQMTASNVIILNVNGKHGAAMGNGMEVDISLRRVRLTTTPWQKAPAISKPALKPPTSGGSKKPVTVKPNASKEVYHVIKRGDTYFALANKYGSTVTQLRTWNPWNDRALPIGGKARVK